MSMTLWALSSTTTQLTLHRQDLGLEELTFRNNLFLVVGVFVSLRRSGLQLDLVMLLLSTMTVKVTIEMLHHLLLIHDQASEHGFHRGQPLV